MRAVWRGPPVAPGRVFRQGLYGSVTSRSKAPADLFVPPHRLATDQASLGRTISFRDGTVESAAE